MNTSFSFSAPSPGYCSTGGFNHQISALLVTSISSQLLQEALAFLEVSAYTVSTYRKINVGKTSRTVETPHKDQKMYDCLILYTFTTTGL